jgi:hypothetical protein
MLKYKAAENCRLGSSLECIFLSGLKSGIRTSWKGRIRTKTRNRSYKISLALTNAQNSLFKMCSTFYLSLNECKILCQCDLLLILKPQANKKHNFFWTFAWIFRHVSYKCDKSVGHRHTCSTDTLDPKGVRAS